MRLPLEEAVEKYEQNVFRAAYAVCSSRQDAEDVCQEAFLAYYRSRKDFDSEEHLKAWLLRTAVNKAKNVCRAFWRRNRESLEDAYGWELRTAPPEERTLLEKVKDGFLADYITVIWPGDGSYSMGVDHFSFPDVNELKENTR